MFGCELASENRYQFANQFGTYCFAYDSSQWTSRSNAGRSNLFCVVNFDILIFRFRLSLIRRVLIKMHELFKEILLFIWLASIVEKRLVSFLSVMERIWTPGTATV
mmetsp:Transcript_9466/g.27181  ORF Transcript_9466/g.27181 Transcript_9466/m.27181 type:complete len:106 (-) Transcript_9466:205-522(-)